MFYFPDYRGFPVPTKKLDLESTPQKHLSKIEKDVIFYMRFFYIISKVIPQYSQYFLVHYILMFSFKQRILKNWSVTAEY